MAISTTTSTPRSGLRSQQPLAVATKSTEGNGSQCMTLAMVSRPRHSARRNALFASVALLVGMDATSAYTSYSAIPQQRQIKWLQELTDDFCGVKTGDLSDDMIASTSQILKGWSACSSRRPNPKHIAAAESIVKRLVDEAQATGNPKAVPLTADYNCLLASWARSGTDAFGAERCESILNEMTISGPRPDLGSYKAVLMAWRHSHVPYGAARAQRVLEHMLWSYSSGTNPDALPDCDCFDLVLQNLSLSPVEKDKPKSQSQSELLLPQRSERLLGVMERWSRKLNKPQIAPRTSSFNAVLGAWSRHGKPEDWMRPVDILSFMHHLSDVEGNDRVRPDGSSYFVVLNVLSKCTQDEFRGACASKADAVLRYAERNAFKNDKGYWKPDTIAYNLAIGSWAKSNVIGAFRPARALLDRQWHMHEYRKELDGGKYDGSSRPDIFSYTSVLSSCASESGSQIQRREAFDTAVQTFEELLELGKDPANDALQPNHVTYGNMLKACNRLLPFSSSVRRKWARKIFHEATRTGQVGEMVLNRLRESVTADEFRTLLQGHTKNDLPSSWTRNVHERVTYRRQSNKDRHQRQRKEV